MPASTYPVLFFNRGLISRLGLARHDIARGRLSAETMTNWMPRVLGSMMLRPGTKYIGATASNNATRMLPFVFANDDTAILELTNVVLRVWDGDTLITRPTVTAAVSNDTFDTDLTGWTDEDESGATSAWVSGGYLGLTGNGSAFAARSQVVTINQASTEHALEIVVTRGPVRLRVGSWDGLMLGDLLPDNIVAEVELATGTDSISFNSPSADDIRITLLSSLKRQVLVSSCEIAAAGVMVLATPWPTAALSSIRYDQSGDVVFVAADGYSQYRIVRRSFFEMPGRSWSVEQYLPGDGPFMVENVSGVTLAPAALSGNTTLTASQRVFYSTHAPTATNAGALFRVGSVGQTVTASITAQNTFTSAIRVTNVETARIFTVTIDEDALGAATFTLQRSLESSTGPWTDVFQRTADTTETFDDGLDNQIAWYRLGVKTGDYVNGTHTVTLNYTLGSITGICRVTSVTSATVANVEVLQDFGGTGASDSWSEGAWSDKQGWPTAVAFHDGRLGWAGRDKVWLSITDAFDSFDDEVEGDSGPISRTISNGPIDRVQWMLSLERLILGGQGAEWSIRASSFDEPLTPTGFSMKAAATQGSAAVQAVRVDRRGIFVQRAGTRVFELNMAADPQGTDYGIVDLTQLVPEVGEPSVSRIAVQRQPDTRLHCVLSDGTAAVLIVDPVENTLCWVKVETDNSSGAAAGLIEDVLVLPGSIEDSVYYVVRRTINAATVRYLEKWALESEAQGDALTWLADAAVSYTGAATTTITGLTHLEGRAVAVWAAGADVGTATNTPTSWTQTYTVSSGQISLATAATNVVVGLPYRARWKSGKLALQAALGTSLTKKKRVHGLGLILADTHAQGLFFGRDFTNMDKLPLVRRGAPVTSTSILTAEEDEIVPFPGDWTVDSRICLEARSPRPVTVLALAADTELHEQR